MKITYTMESELENNIRILLLDGPVRPKDRCFSPHGEEINPDLLVDTMDENPMAPFEDHTDNHPNCPHGPYAPQPKYKEHQ